MSAKQFDSGRLTVCSVIARKDRDSRPSISRVIARHTLLHCVARCVRRLVVGFDQYAGRDYSHRKAWVLKRIAKLTSIFAIDVCAYAIMSNHYHLDVLVPDVRCGLMAARNVSAETLTVKFNKQFALALIGKAPCNVLNGVRPKSLPGSRLHRIDRVGRLGRPHGSRPAQP
jgi:hypothetical protein